MTQQHKAHSTDVAIIGGGLAGFSLAVALQQTNLNVTLVNAQPDTSNKKQKPDEAEKNQFDDRALALSYASIEYLKSINVLNDEDIDGLTAIKHIHISDKGHIGLSRLDSDEVKVPYLGKVILAKNLGNRLAQLLGSIDKENFQHLSDTKVDRINHHKDQAVLSLSGKNLSYEQVNAKLVVMAEGGYSGLCEQLGLQGECREYDQVGILANVATSALHNNMAYERFTSTGPIALLPLREKDYKLVWTVQADQADDIMALNQQQFLNELQIAFGDRAGIFEQVGKRVSYPMFEVQRTAMHSGRVVLIGNSAHTLHPIAGQGFNLGLRDIKSLLELLESKSSTGDDISEICAQFSAMREKDVKRTSLFTDSLVRVFSNNSFPSSVLRNVGLTAFQNMPLLKKRFIRKMTGNG